MTTGDSDTTQRTVSGTLAGVSGVAGGGLVGLGVAGGVVVAWGFSCASGMDDNSGPFGGEFGLVSFIWLVVAVFLGPLALLSFLAGLASLLASGGLARFAFRREPPS